MKILSSDGQQSIGATRFTISSDNGNETIEGETRYRDDQHDNERESIRLLNGAPRLEKPRAFVLQRGRYCHYDRQARYQCSHR
jgi:hypothetical protein